MKRQRQGFTFRDLALVLGLISSAASLTALVWRLAGKSAEGVRHMIRVEAGEDEL